MVFVFATKYFVVVDEASVVKQQNDGCLALNHQCYFLVIFCKYYPLKDKHYVLVVDLIGVNYKCSM